MFFKLAILCLFLSYVFTAPAPADVVPLEKQLPTVIPIVSQSEELEANGTYKFSYETGNGIKREETSYEKMIPITRSSDNKEGDASDESNEIHVQQGSYSYVAPDGTVISVKYIADENGFRPVGDHLPRAPVLVAQTQKTDGEKSGRSLLLVNQNDKSKVKPKDDSNNESIHQSKEESSTKTKLEESPKATEGTNTPSLLETTAVSSEKISPEAPTKDISQTKDAATTVVPKEVPVSTAVTASEAASTTEVVSVSEAAVSQKISVSPAVTTIEVPAKTAPASEAISTTAATLLEAGPNTVQSSSESSSTGEVLSDVVSTTETVNTST